MLRKSGEATSAAVFVDPSSRRRRAFRAAVIAVMLAWAAVLVLVVVGLTIAPSAPRTAASAAPTASQPPAATPSAPTASGWQLTWSDEFSGPAGSPPDASKWGHQVGGSGWGNKELEYDTDSTANAAFDGRGHLLITARRGAPHGASCWYGRCQYTSARLITAGRFSQAYGRISARIKVPAGTGTWPSFWALGDNYSSVGWPRSGQLSIMSHLGRLPATVSGGLIGPGYYAWSSDTLGSGTFAGSYHTFSADWYPDHISFFVDGHLYDTQYRDSAGAGWVFDHPFFLILNLAVGGTQAGSPGPGTSFPQPMAVDWVRVYQAVQPRAAVTGAITGLSGKCAEAGNGGAVQLDSCASTAAQTWTVATDGTVRALGQCLTVTAAGNGTRAVLAPCNGSAGQQWRAESNGQLVSLLSQRCLDATNGSTASFTPLRIWDCAGQGQQQWKLP